jgi:hypothetical protein
MLLSASRLPGVAAAAPETHNFQDGIFYDETELFAERHLFPEIISDSPCTRPMTRTHEFLPLFFILLYYWIKSYAPRI